jgi:hypothetical protein
MLALLLTAWLTAAEATTVLPLSFDEVEARASVIIVATITRATPWRDAGGLIRTDLELSDVRRVGGPGPAPTRLTFTGGEIGRIGVRVHGMPAWEIGGRAVFFVEGDGRTTACPTVGWGQGYLPLDAADRLRHPRPGLRTLDDVRARVSE